MPLKIIFIGLQAYNLEKNAKHFSRLLNFLKAMKLLAFSLLKMTNYEKKFLQKEIFQMSYSILQIIEKCMRLE